MKKIVKGIAALLAAAAALTACKAELKESLETPHEISFSCGEVEDPVEDEAEAEETGEIETRTVFGTGSGNTVPTLWTANQKVDIIYSGKGGLQKAELSVTPTSNGKTAKFVGTIKPSSGTAFVLLSPAACYSSHSTTGAEIVVPTTQTPTSASPDEKAMVLGAATGKYVSLPTTVKFSPKHMTSYIALTLKNVVSVGTVKSVTVTATVPLSGNATFDYSSENMVIKAASSGTSNSVTAKTSSSTGVLFACLPAKVSGKKLTIKVVGAESSLTREITVPSGKNLLPGKIAFLTVDMNPSTSVSVTGVTVSPTTLTLPQGSSATLTATVTPSNATDKSVTWLSSQPLIASVTSDGVVKGLKPGTSTITVKTNDGGKTATCAVTVVKAATKIEILNKNDGVDPLYDEGYLHVTKTKPAIIQYMVTYSDGSTEKNSGATVSISSSTGGFAMTPPRQVSAQSAGNTATVKVTSNVTSTVSASISLKSWDDPTSIEWIFSIPLASGARWCKTGQTYEVAGKVYPSTARQKVVLEARENTDYWVLTRTSAAKYYVKAPEFSASDYRDYVNKMSILRLSAWHDSSVYFDYSINVTNIDVSKPKLFDFIAFNESTKQYRIFDGGLRISGTGDDFYCSNVSLSVPSGFKVVGIITYYPENPKLQNPYEIYSQGVCNLEVTSGIIGPDGTTLPNNQFHGFAIAMYNAVADIWCAENDDVDGNANWSRELGGDGANYSKTQVADSQRNNGFMLTIAAHQYNVWRGSSHAIRPADRVWDYGEPGVLYQCLPFPTSTPSLTWVMRPWFVPTINNWEALAANGKYYNTKRMNKLNEQIDKVGFGDKVFPYQTDSYWTINTAGGSSDSKKYAYIVYSEGSATRAKSNSAGVRPFMIF